MKDILEHADELAARFENYESNDDDERHPTEFAARRAAVLARSVSQRAVLDAVEEARAKGDSWAFIGQIIGTSGEAARQRYGHKSDA